MQTTQLVEYHSIINCHLYKPHAESLPGQSYSQAKAEIFYPTIPAINFYLSFATCQQKTYSTTKFQILLMGNVKGKFTVTFKSQ